MTTIRYRLPVGDRFTIRAGSHERVSTTTDVLLDLTVGFSLVCDVVAADGDVVDISGRFSDSQVDGHVLDGPPPDVGALDGLTIAVRKGLDGTIRAVDGGEPFERLLGGLTVANGLRWFGAAFPDGDVDVGAEWTTTDRWWLRSDRSPVGIPIPVEPVVDIWYRYRLVDAGVDGPASMSVAIDARGRTVSDALGLEVRVWGVGTGSVEVNRAVGKLTRSERRATLDIVPLPLRRRALALPRLRVERQSEAAFTDTT